MINVTFKLSNLEHEEGAGSFYQRPFLAYLFAIDNNFNFINTYNQLSSLHYEPSEVQFINSLWQKIFSFLGECIDIDVFPPDFDSTKNHDDQTIYNVPFRISYEYLQKLNIHQREILLDTARKVFYANMQQHYPELCRKNDEFTIAIHLRDFSKGDPPKSIKLIDWQIFSYDYGLPDNNPEYYARMFAFNINKIISKVKPIKPILNVHSTGNKETYSYFLSLLDPDIKVNLLLNEPAPYSFLDLIYSDILIASHSSFSWLALLLRDKPSYIRRGFRHFITDKTQILDEVLFTDHQSIIKKGLIKIDHAIKYRIFKNKLKKL